MSLECRRLVKAVGTREDLQTNYSSPVTQEERSALESVLCPSRRPFARCNYFSMTIFILWDRYILWWNKGDFQASRSGARHVRPQRPRAQRRTLVSEWKHVCPRRHRPWRISLKFVYLVHKHVINSRRVLVSFVHFSVKIVKIEYDWHPTQATKPV